MMSVVLKMSKARDSFIDNNQGKKHVSLQRDAIEAREVCCSVQHRERSMRLYLIEEP